MTPISSILPDHEVLLALEPEELAGYLLESLNRVEKRGRISRHNDLLAAYLEAYPRERVEEIRMALMEAWVWLEHEGLLAPAPGAGPEWFFVTRRGTKVKSHTDLAAMRKSDMLPRRLLHPVIAQKVRSLFVRGEYDTAVFQAFKEVEVAVRGGGGFGPTDLGTDLMRKAFDPETGPLADKSLPVAERQAMSHLFAGAIGCYKNPSSHRHVVISDPADAVEMIMLASHLLKIVDARTPKKPES